MPGWPATPLLPEPAARVPHLLAVARRGERRAGEGAHRRHRQPLVTAQRGQRGNVEASRQVQAGGSAAVGAVVSAPDHCHHGRLEAAVAGDSGLRVVPPGRRGAVAVRGRGQSLR